MGWTNWGSTKTGSSYIVQLLFQVTDRQGVRHRLPGAVHPGQDPVLGYLVMGACLVEDQGQRLAHTLKTLLVDRVGLETWGQCYKKILRLITTVILTLLFLGLKWLRDKKYYCHFRFNYALQHWLHKYRSNLLPFYSNYQGNVAL